MLIFTSVEDTSCRWPTNNQELEQLSNSSFSKCCSDRPEQIEIAVKKALPWVISFNSWFLCLGILPRQGNKLRCEEGKQKIQWQVLYTPSVIGYFYLLLNFGKFSKRRVLYIFFPDWMEILPLVNIERKSEISELHVYSRITFMYPICCCGQRNKDLKCC